MAVIFLQGLREYKDVVNINHSNSVRYSLIVLFMNLGAVASILVRPNGITRNLNNIYQVLEVVFHSWPFFIWI